MQCYGFFLISWNKEMANLSHVTEKVLTKHFDKKIVLKRRLSITNIMLPCYGFFLTFRNKEMANLNRIPEKVLAKYFAKKILLKRHLSIINISVPLERRCECRSWGSNLVIFWSYYLDNLNLTENVKRNCDKVVMSVWLSKYSKFKLKQNMHF